MSLFIGIDSSRERAANLTIIHPPLTYSSILLFCIPKSLSICSQFYHDISTHSPVLVYAVPYNLSASAVNTPNSGTRLQPIVLLESRADQDGPENRSWSCSSRDTLFSLLHLIDTTATG